MAGAHVFEGFSLGLGHYKEDFHWSRKADKTKS